MVNDQPQTIRVFVSSTFVDLFSEREYLVKRVFPEIRHICRERGIIFTEIDLRWGLTYEDSSFGRVISTCLQEIDRCRPFFLGILGERYGWIPEFQDIHKNAFLMEEHRWLEEAVLEGSSLVEMEFNYAVLNSNEPMPGASFYLLDRPSRKAELNYQQTELEEHKLEALRERIRDCKRPVRTFTTPEELGKQVRDDLLRAIDVLHPAKNERSPLDRERRLHESFSLSRRQAYVGRQETLRALSDHIATDAQPLVVHGASGIGKSALLAYWSRFYAQRHPDTLVVAHFIGSVTSDTGHEGLLRRILLEIKELINLESPLPDSVEEMEKALVEWMAKVPEKKLVLVIDALNQLEPRAAGLEWLPQHLPANVRIVVSTTPGPTLDALRTRGWPEFELLPLTMQDREAMITRFLSEFHKALTLTECKAIALDPKAESPLFLRTLLEELRLFGTYERLDERIEHYLKSRDIGDLFQRVLERIEQDFGAGLVRQIMTLVWASKSGLTEDDFLSLTKLQRAEASQLLITLEYHLVQRQGYIRFFHDYLREAVERKYLTDDESRRQAHAELGAFYLTEPSSERRAQEIPYQLGEGQMLDELKDWLTDIPEFMRYATEDTQWQYIGYWLKLKDKYERAPSYEAALEKYKAEHTELEYAEALEQVGRFMNACGDYAAASKMLEESLPIIEGHYGPNDEHTASILSTYGMLLHSRGRYAEAEKRLAQALKLAEAIYGEKHQLAAKALDQLATAYYSIGKYFEAEQLLRKALSINQELFGPNNQHTIQTLMNIGVMLYSMQMFGDAELILEQALAATLNTFGSSHPEYANLLSNLAAVQVSQQKYDDAISHYKIARQINEQVFGRYHPSTVLSLRSLGVALTLNGNLAEAETCCTEALNLSTQVHGPRHRATATAQLNLGQLLIEEGMFERASEILLQAYTTFMDVLGEAHASTIRAAISLAGSYYRAGRYRDAVDLYSRFILAYNEGEGNVLKARTYYENSLRLVANSLEAGSTKADVTERG